MMLRTITTIALLLLPHASQAEVKQLSERLFWIGPLEETLRLPSHGAFLTQMKWMRPLLWNDAVLGRKKIVFYERNYVVADQIRTPRNGEFLIPPGDIDVWDGAGLYDGYAIRVEDPVRTNFIPRSGENFHATCHYTHERDRFITCSVRRDYPPDKHAELSAGFIRFDAATATDPFKPIADRLLELAYCLDVTNEAPAKQDIERKPLDCDLETTA